MIVKGDGEGLAGYRIAAVVPAYKVEREIAAVLASIPDYVSRVIVVDDASPDQTAGVLAAAASSDSRIEIVTHARNQGVGGAVITGMRRALEGGAQIVVKVDADGQAPIEQLPGLLAPLLSGRADMAKANRFRDFDALGRMPLVRRIGNTVLSFLVKAATGYWSTFDPTNGFLAVRADVLRQLRLERLARSYFFEISLLSQLYLSGAVIRDVPIAARYGKERSNLSILRVLIEFPPRLLATLVRRLFLKYAVYDFSMGSVFFLAGLPLLTFGLLFGSARWAHYSRLGISAPTGTVMLATMSVLLGVQFLLSAIGVDLQNVPREPISTPLQPAIRQPASDIPGG